MRIGLDFGNMNSFPCAVLNMNENTRVGGREYSLLPDNGQYNSGIPTCYFCSPDGEENDKFGLEAKRSYPVANQRFLLKRRLRNDEDFPIRETIGDRMVEYDEVITKMVEHIVRKANQVMFNELGETSNEVSLAYPVDFQPSIVQRLVGLVNKATLEDGRHVQVTGRIPEPAAAALAYLSRDMPKKNAYNVAVYDLGGGTLDVASVTAYPSGKMIHGQIKYFDIDGQDGARIGGNEFDDILEQIAYQKLGKQLTGKARAIFRVGLEQAKISLDTEPNVLVPVGLEDDIRVTKAEFEAAAKPLVKQTIDVLENMLTRQDVPKPELILLTGGQSQMPLIRQMLMQRFPDYGEDQVISYSPQQAIAIGAAKYGVMAQFVQKYNQYALGFLLTNDVAGGEDTFIDIRIPEHSVLPTPESERIWAQYQTRVEGRYVNASIYEAVKLNPNVRNYEHDFTKSLQFDYDFGRVVPKGTPDECCMYVDEEEQVHVRVREPDRPNDVQEAQVRLINIE